MSPSYITPHSILAVGIVLPTLATLAVTGRFIGRKLQRLPLGKDDWFILVSLVSHWLTYFGYGLVVDAMGQIPTIGMGIALIYGILLWFESHAGLHLKQTSRLRCARTCSTHTYR